MADCGINVLGVYRVPLTGELFEKAMNIKYGRTRLSFWDKRKAEKTVREELSSVVLIEAVVTNPDENFDIGDFGQPNSDQAPYDEAYFSLDGCQIVSKFDKPDGNKIRITFFLHYYDPLQPLTTCSGVVSCPPIQDMPKRLKEIVSYEPVD